MAKGKVVLGLVAAGALAGGVFLYQNFGSILTRTVEGIASNALGVKVDIGNIQLSLSDKSVTVNSLAIGNPPGYRNANAMTAKKIIIGLNTADESLIDFKDIQVQGSVVNLEVNEKGMNLDDLRKLAAGKEQREATGSKQVRVIVQHMVVEATEVNPSVTLLDHKVKPITVPAIKFSNIGKGGGVSAEEAVVQVMGKYLSAIEKAAQKEGMLEGFSTGVVDDVKKKLDDAAGSLKGLLR